MNEPDAPKPDSGPFKEPGYVLLGLGVAARIASWFTSPELQMSRWGGLCLLLGAALVGLQYWIDKKRAAWNDTHPSPPTE